MLDKDFQNAKQTLLNKLPDYLKSKGINVSTNFMCLNPHDQGQLRSMAYDDANKTVNCFNCKSKYNIFDLIGIDFSLPNFSQQFAKAYEMYIGKLPIGFIEILSSLDKAANQPKEQYYKTTNDSNYGEKPKFEIDEEPRRPALGQIDEFGDQDHLKFEKPQFHIENRISSLPQEPFGASLASDQFSQNNVNPERQGGINSISPFDEAKLQPFSLSGNKPAAPSNTEKQSTFGGFGQAQNIADSIHSSKVNKEIQDNQPKFGESDSSPFLMTSKEMNYDYSQYISKCALNVNRTDFFRKKGLSDEIISRFSLGYDDSVHSDFDAISGSSQQKSEAVIIPYGESGYIEKIIAPNGTTKIIRKGHVGIFNKIALNKEGNIFITQNELDALSLETLGYSAISIGTVDNIKLLVDTIQNSSTNHFYYVCLHNDSEGIIATNTIGSLLYKNGLNFKCLNLSYPYANINAALCSSRELLTDRLVNLKNILSFRFDAFDEITSASEFITSEQHLMPMRMVPEQYCFCGSPLVLRKLTSKIAKNNEAEFIFASSSVQWKLMKKELSTYVSGSFDPQNFKRIKHICCDIGNFNANMKAGIESHLIQGNQNFVLCVDLTSFTEKDAIDTVNNLGSICESLSGPMILLCNRVNADAIEGLCTQRLNIDTNDRGDFGITSLGGAAQKISFFISGL